MPASGAAARKAPPGSPQYPTKNSLIDKSLYEKAFASNDKKTVKLKAKKPTPKQSAPGNWSDNKIEGVSDKTGKADKEKEASSPIVNSIDDRIAAAFPSGRPFEDICDSVQCKHCKKPILRLAAAAHVRDCLKRKQEKLQKKKEAKEAKDAALRKERNGGVSPDVEGEEGGEGKRGSISARKTAVAGEDVSSAKKTGKKRKAEDDGKAGAKKKKKDEPKSKSAKPKGPVDVEKQCGVPLGNGQLCARSLTCKSHSMGAKRAVPGRSLPYDMLLAQYQKKNQAKQQRAAIDAATAALADDLADAPGTIDSDEERDTIMSAFSRAFRPNPFTGARIGGQPLISQPLVPTRSKYKFVRMKEMLQHALGGVKGGNLFATPHSLSQNQIGLGLGMMPDSAGGETFGNHSRRPSVSRSSIHPISRKPSISGAV